MMQLKTAKLFLLIFLTMYSFAHSRSMPLIIDHNCEDLSKIPLNWIDTVQDIQKWHYAHTSHGGQLTTGLQRIEDSDPTYNIARGSSYLPSESDALCIFDGQEGDTYISPEDYWETKTGMDKTRAVLNHNSTINISQWAWCCQLNNYSETQVQAYLDSISTLETEFPNVTFVYISGNAQGTGSSGYNRYLRNEQIRQFCKEHNKVLYDFADLDAWWYNTTTEEWEQNTYVYNEQSIPVEHTQFNGNETGHTTFTSCEQKGRAVWWMMARLAGWEEGTSIIDNGAQKPSEFELKQNYPNPFGEGRRFHSDPTTVINYQMSALSHVKLTVYNALGQVVNELVNENQPAGSYRVLFNASNLSSGVYLYKLSVNRQTQIRKMILMR